PPPRLSGGRLERRTPTARQGSWRPAAAGSPSPSAASPHADAPADQEYADKQKRERRQPQRPGGRLVGRLVTDPAAVALDKPGADRRRFLAGRDASPHQIAHIASKLGVGIRDRLSLADEAAQLFHQRLGLRLLLGIGQLAVGPEG